MTIFYLLSYLLILLLSFYLLADICENYFVKSLDKISQKLKLSHEASGATLMAIGSSAPELFIAIIALIHPGNHETIGMGTIVGSALFNILVIIGFITIVKNTKLQWQIVSRDLFFYAISILLLLISFWDGHINLFETITFLSIYIIYVMAVIDWKNILKYKDDIIELFEIELKKENKKKNILTTITYPFKKVIAFIFPSAKHYILNFLLSITLIAFLSWILVEMAINISTILNIPEAIMALTVLAAGTSVPDLVSSVLVARQGRSSMAIANAIGSNIFDILIGLGFPWILTIIIYKKDIIVSTHNLYSSIILLFATIIVISSLFIIRKWKVGKYVGYFLISLYILYVIWAVS